MANESIARTCLTNLAAERILTDDAVEHNLALQDSLYNLRSETKDTFDEAKALEARWKDLEKEQREVYQVRLRPWKQLGAS